MYVCAGLVSVDVGVPSPKFHVYELAVKLELVNVTMELVQVFTTPKFALGFGAYVSKSNLKIALLQFGLPFVLE